MKKITFILSVLLIASCSKELDINPATSVDSAEAKKSVDLLVAGAYALIGSGGPVGQEGGLYATDILLNGDLLAPENYMIWRGTFDQYKEVSNKLMSATNTTTTRMWVKGYAAINLANVILADLSDLNESDRNLYKAQALFIRGIVEFELLRFWMEPSTDLGIPILTLPTEDFSEIKSPKRETIAASYTAIIDDLTTARDLLPEDNIDVYANKYTAAAFLARVYLQKGDYANALAQTNEIIESGKYALPTSVEDAFNTDGSEETIFEIQQTTQNNTGTANDGLTTFYSCDSNTPGSAGRGDVQIDDAFLSQYESSDKRLSVLIYTGDCNKASTTSGKWRNPYTNIPIIRLSEMYLVRAEANSRLTSAEGDTPLNDINLIRSKAGATPYDTDVTLDQILNERDLELAFEGQRIHDYKRLGKIVLYKGDMITYTDPQFILPIPQSEINTNKNIVQNSYYKKP